MIQSIFAHISYQFSQAMNKNDTRDGEDLLETLALTAKIQNKLKHLISSKKLHNKFAEQDEINSESSDLYYLHAEIRRLQHQNQELLTDNQQLCRDLLRIRQEKDVLDKEVAQNRDYIKYLQQHCKCIKKQLLFWIRKPAYQKTELLERDKADEMLNEVQRLRRENDARQLQLQQLRYRDQTNQYNTTLKSRYNKQFDNYHNLFSNEDKQAESLRNSVGFNKKSSCTSCNYQLHSGSKNKLKARHKRTGSEIGLCQCHKHYIQTGHFKR